MAKQLYHYDKDGRHKVSEVDGKLITTDTGKEVTKVTTHPNLARNSRPDHAINNPFYGSGRGEWDDYAHTSDDL